MARVIYGTGEIVRARVTYTDPDTGLVTDPIAVSVVVRQPNGTKTTYVYGVDPELTKVSIGLYQILITLSEDGTYKWKWTGTAASKATVDYDECDAETEAGF